MGQEVAQRTPQQLLVEQVRSDVFKRQIEEALPERYSPARFLRITTTALLENPELAEANPASVFAGLLKAAADGLVPDGREAALVVGRGKGGPAAIYLPMIGGYRKIAAEHGWSLRTFVVREGDVFSYVAGEKPVVEHRPGPSTEEVTHAYAIAKHRVTGQTELLVMDRADIEKRRRASRAPDSPAWKNWFGPMCEKTVGRALFKQLPLDPADKDRIDHVLRADELEPGKAEELVYGATEIPARSTPGEGADTAAADGAPTAPESEEGAPQPVSDSEPLFEGEEPEPESVFKDELLDFVLDSDRFPKRGGTSIRELVEAGDKRYLRWLSTEVKDEEVNEAAKAGLEALS